jgi:hypothetical protein
MKLVGLLVSWCRAGKGVKVALKECSISYFTSDAGGNHIWILRNTGCNKIAFSLFWTFIPEICWYRGSSEDHSPCSIMPHPWQVVTRKHTSSLRNFLFRLLCFTVDFRHSFITARHCPTKAYHTSETRLQSTHIPVPSYCSHQYRGALILRGNNGYNKHCLKLICRTQWYRQVRFIIITGYSSCFQIFKIEL